MMRIGSAALAALLLAIPAAAAEPITGAVEHGSVVDGDTFDLGEHRIRLWGCDAPEIAHGRRASQPYGDEAKARLQALIEGKAVACEPKGRSRDRVVAQCRVAGRDLCSALVADGLAWDEARFSRGHYRLEEASAACAGLGIWSQGAMPPWDFRECNK